MKNKSNRGILSVLIFIILFISTTLVVTYKGELFSKAEEHVSVKVVESEDKAKNFLYELQIKKEDNKKIVTLPESINGNLVKEYQIIEKKAKVQEFVEEAENKVQNKVEEKVENKIENNVEEKAEVKVENIVQEKVENTVNEKAIKNEITSQNIVNTEEKELKENVNETKPENTIVKQKSEQIEKNKPEVIEQEITEPEVVAPNETYEITSNEVEIYAVLDVVTKNGLKLYNSIVEEDYEDVSIKLIGYLPKESKIKYKKITDEEKYKTKIEEYAKSEASVLAIYDISVEYEGKEYEPYEFDEKVKVSIKSKTGNASKDTSLFHINDKNKIEELEIINNINNTIEFETKGFSPFILANLLSDEEEIEDEEENNIQPLTNDGEVKKVIYVNNGTDPINGISYPIGKNTNDGLTPQTAVETLVRAYQLLDENLTREEQYIVIMGNHNELSNSAYLSYNESNTSNLESSVFTKQATITGKYGDVDYKGNLYLIAGVSNTEDTKNISNYLYADTTFENLKFSGSSNTTTYIFCQGRNLTMGEGLSMAGVLLKTDGDTSTGVIAGKRPDFQIVAGWQSYNANSKQKDEATEIILKSGAYARIILANRMGVDRAAQRMSFKKDKPFNVKLTVDIQEHDSAYDYDINSLYGGNGEGSVYMNSEVNISNGLIGRFVAGSRGNDVKETTIPGNTFFGSTVLNMDGGSIYEFWGASLGSSRTTAQTSTKYKGNYQFGKIDMNIKGGTIGYSKYGNKTTNMYGGAGGAVTGYFADSTYEWNNLVKNQTMIDLYGNTFKLDDMEINMNITGGTIYGNIYGGGYGWSDRLQISQLTQDAGYIYGNININISDKDNPTVIKGNIFGGGRGYESYGSTIPTLASVVGDVKINITGNPTIEGNVYGGGEGTSLYKDMAKVTGNVDINIDSKDGVINKNLFGGGNAGEVTGDVNLNILEGTIKGNVYGGGNSATVNKVTMNIGSSDKSKTSIVKLQNVYGGNNQTDYTEEKSIATVEINLYDNITCSNIYGGCNSKGLILSKVDITANEDVSLQGNIYGAGFGADSYVGLVKDTNNYEAEVNINILKNATIKNGNIYGGGSSGQVFGPINIENNGNLTSTKGVTTDKKAGYIFAGGYGESATVHGDTTVTFGEEEKANAVGIFGGGYSGSVLGNANIQVLSGNVKEIFGAGLGSASHVEETTINVENATVDEKIYGGGYAGSVNGNTILTIDKSEIGIEDDDNGFIFGGGEGKTALVYGTTDIKVSNSKIYGEVFGGGNAGDVISDANVLIHDDSTVTIAVYGGGNEANIGTLEKWNNGQYTNTNVKIYDADIGKYTNARETPKGEVFGGGNLGIVYGDTVAEVGTTEEGKITNVQNQFYAGGRGDLETTTVYGNSNGIIAGRNTEVAKYGDISLGAVQGDVNITFIEYKKQSLIDKYKNMTGINKATNMTLDNSYVYLTEGLKEITNLYVPKNSGIMISEESQIWGDFHGGGELYLQNEVCLTIGNNLCNDGITKLTLNPEKVDNNEYYIIQGNNFSPYVKVVGIDETNGTGIVSGNKRRYEIYNMSLDDNIQNRYNCTSKNFMNVDGIYKSIGNAYDEREYYYDSGLGLFYTSYAEEAGLDGKYKDSNNVIQTKNCDSTYYVETTIIIASYANVFNHNIDDKAYAQEVTNPNDISILKDTYFTSQNDILLTMVKEVIDGKWQFMKPEDFQNVRRMIHLENQDGNIVFPQGTVITMITDDQYYYYVFTGDEGDLLELTEFRNASGTKYSEVTNVKEILYQADELTPAIWEIEEKFKFVVDFSNCTTYLPAGNYSLIMDLYDILNNDGVLDDEDMIHTNLSETSIQIDDRTYKYDIVNPTKEETYRQDDIIQINSKLSLEDISVYNVMDVGKNVELKLEIIDKSTNKIVDIPAGTIVTINGEQAQITNDDIIKTAIIENLAQNEYLQDVNITIDMSAVNRVQALKAGNYSLNIDFYLANDNGVLFENKPKVSNSIDFKIKEILGYGLKIVYPDNDQEQLILNNETSSKTVNIEYENGNLENGAYIQVETLKRNSDESLEYTPMNSLALVQKITNLKDITSDIIFDEKLENGTYKMVYKLYDCNDNFLTSASINFIVQRD